jgi:hypothetical protein
MEHLSRSDKAEPTKNQITLSAVSMVMLHPTTRET